MPRGKSRRGKNYWDLKRIGGAALVVGSIAMLLVAWVYPILAASPNPLESLIPIDEELTEEEVLDNPQVTVKVYAKKLLARTNSDQNIDIYNYNMEYVETVTTSSGVATCSYMYHTEQNLYLQARQAAPGTADPYVTPMTLFEVPTGDAGDTVSLGTIWVRDVTATAATLSVRDLAGATIDDNTVDYFNTTDTAFTVTLTSIDEGTYYGMESFTDYQTDREYVGGVFFVWKGTVGQSFAADYAFADGTNVYYVFFVADTLVDDGNIANDNIIAATIATQGGASLVADSTVTLDVYDGIWLINGGVSTTASFIDTQSVTAITTKVA